MFMRLVQMKVDPERITGFKEVYEHLIIPALQQTPGCAYAGLVQSLENEGDGISITLWSNQDDASTYERSGRYAEALEKARPFFSDSIEWRVQLSVDLRPEFSPVPPGPVVKSYATSGPALNTPGLPGGPEGSMYLRILSMKLKPATTREFAEIYHREIIPALRKVEGCLDAYLAEGGRSELLSVTLWTDLAHAKAYDASGEFDRLKEKVKHTFSDLARWKMALDNAPVAGSHRPPLGTTTGDDSSVRTYSVLIGEAFRRH